MRTMIALTLIALAALVAADEPAKEAKQTQRYEVALDAKELTDGVESLADLLEKKLSGPAGEYYQVLVVKNRLYGRLGTCGGGLLFVLGIALIWLGCWLSERSKFYSSYIPASIAIGIVLSIVGLILPLVWTGTYLAPEYHAMREFLRTASQFMP